MPAKHIQIHSNNINIMAKIDKKILLVEDDEDFRFILQKKFELEGFTIITAKDGQEGISMTEKEKPDLIFSDMLIPKIDGATMAKKIREKNAAVPIIFLTIMKDVNSTLEAQKSGQYDYLIKADTRIADIVEKAKAELGIR